MKTLFPVVVAVVLGLTGCIGNSPTTAGVLPPPTIKSFSVDNPKLLPGEQTKLRFATENATEVEIVDQKGRRYEIVGDVNSGEAIIIPTETSFYVLRAKGDGGADTAFAQVAVGEPLNELFLVAVPGDIDPG